MESGDWAGPNEGLGHVVRDQVARCLATYREDARRVEQDGSIESSIAQGGYGRKQLYELIQNGADAMLEEPGRIHVVLTRDCLYVANEGRPMAEAGVHALMASHLSRKRGDEIGRFGLGFKSVAAISDSPDVFSRSGSFGFDRAWAQDVISGVVGDSPTYPMMRIARPLDAAEEAATDSTLKELAGWATTVIRVPFARAYESLADDLVKFPAAFLLFSPHARELVMTDAVVGTTRTVTVDQLTDGELRLADSAIKYTKAEREAGLDRARWRVAKRFHRPSKDALEDAGDLAHRNNISVSWAVNLSDRSSLGQLWAFFPTQEKTTLSGIINAPWKLTEDRRNLLPGEFNKEILTRVLPAIVANEWADLFDENDPGSVLDLLPARGREERSWADKVLNKPVVDAVRVIPSLPDTSRRLRSPRTLRIHPSGLKEDAWALWEAVQPAPEGWIHSSVDRDAERRAKAGRLMAGGEEASSASVAEWIEAVVEKPTVAASAAAVDLVRRLSRDPGLGSEARRARVVLLEDETLAPALRGRVFVRSSQAEEGYAFIHPELAAMPGVINALTELGIQVLDRVGELRNALTGGNLVWPKVWSLVRGCPQDTAYEMMRDELGGYPEQTIKVRNRAGSFVPLGAVFVPGGVIKPGARGDEKFTLDVDFHRDDLELLDRLGAVSQPVLRGQVPTEAWVRSYEDLIKESFVQGSTGAKPSIEKLVVEGPVPPWPLAALSELTPPAKVAMTETALALASGQLVTVRHATATTYAPRRYNDPVMWWVHKHGLLETGVGPFPARACLRRVDESDFPDEIFPTADVSEDVARQLGLKTELSDLDDAVWTTLFKTSERWESTRRNLLYAWAAYHADPPEKLVSAVGEAERSVDRATVAVVDSAEDYRSLVEQRQPVIFVPDADDVEQLISAWGLENGKSLLEQELVFEPSGEPQVLIDVFPQLRLWDVATSVMLQLCESIDLVTMTNQGTRSRPISSYLRDEVILLTATDQREALRVASDVLQLGLDADDIDSVIDHQRSQEADRTIGEIRSAPTVEDKLALVAGSEHLARQVPSAALEAVNADLGREPSARELAKLVLAVHGVRSLQVFKPELEELGLNPPTKWVGGSQVRRFVSDLGFPLEYAGFAGDLKPQMFEVDGPAELEALHEYQVIVTSKIKAMLRGTEKARGMVSLPTGAGKTRVAVQALVEEMAEGNLAGPIVWIAQSDELCEQAVETWSYIWRAKGPSRPLHVGRLWGTREVEEVGTGTQLVVATPQKLLSCKSRGDQYDWLTANTVIVVDEAHSSVAPMYTEVLEWLGRSRNRKDGRPLIGLTATPFRNTNEAETSRLVDRYGAHRLDEGAFVGDPYEYLQQKQVLATVDQEVLAGAEIEMSPEELADTRKFRDIPRSVQVRLGTNAARNNTILASIASLPEDWTVLLFATSVDNARVLASLLTFRGIPAVAISADTDMAARRHYIEEFKAGRIRVITNYNVLAQGFDAPAVKAVYVTRPTYSVNLYQQMIGRGLRGPKNGGSESVRIVNVDDNVRQYGEHFAFTAFEHLWKAKR